jgi:pyruvate/2-oxoglutarate dehydrogenase complex dihydrolipoamide dehydrogenase (E3) component
VVLGGGSAGTAAALKAGSLGLKTLLIEKDAVGGEGLNTGCVPSKALIHAARVAHTMASGGGVFPGHAVTRRQGAAALEYARKSVARVREASTTQTALRQRGVEVKVGHARFVDEDAIEINGHRITANDFILCAGSSPAVPDVPGLHEAGYLTNRTLWDLKEIPESLAVIGGGSVGVELAQAFARLGSEVSLIEAGDHILPRDDNELSEMLAGILRAEGVNVHLDATLTHVHSDAAGLSLRLQGYFGPSEVRCTDVLVATGRTPNVEGLNLEAASVQVGRHGVIADASLHTTGPRVWACGDIHGESAYAHMAIHEARRIVQSIFLPVDAKPGFDAQPWATFTEPELAHLGLTEQEAANAGFTVDVLRFPFAQDDRAQADGETAGLVKVITEGWRGRILGVHILGPRAGELINEWTLAVHHGLGVRAVADQVHVYPSLGMASQNAALKWYETKSQEPSAQRALSTYNKVRENPEPLLYTLAGVAAAGGLILATKALVDRAKAREQAADAEDLDEQ